MFEVAAVMDGNAPIDGDAFAYGAINDESLSRKESLSVLTSMPNAVRIDDLIFFADSLANSFASPLMSGSGDSGIANSYFQVVVVRMSLITRNHRFWPFRLALYSLRR